MAFQLKLHARAVKSDRIYMENNYYLLMITEPYCTVLFAARSDFFLVLFLDFAI